MKKYLQISLLSSLLVLPAAATLAADMASNGSATPTSMHTMTMMDVLNKLDAAGYHAIKEVEMGTNGTYKVDTINAKGEKVEFTVDPAKPEIAAQPQGIKILTAAEVTKKVMDAGYNNITKIKFKGDSYDVKAHDKNGKAVKLDVNIVTGDIQKDWF